MSLLDRWLGRADVIRVGSEQLELYRQTAAGLALRARQSLDRDSAQGQTRLAVGLDALLAASKHTDHRSRSIHVVLESAWAPVMLVPAGERPWMRQPMEALLRHRLSTLYGEPGSGWELRLVHRAGDMHGLGFGLSGTVKETVEAACAVAGVSLASLQPAFDWGWQANGRRPSTQKPSWWVWIEQDRCLIARLAQGRVVALNPAAELAPSLREQQGYWESCISMELMRQGQATDEAEPILVGSWEPLDALTQTGRVTRWSVTNARPELAEATPVRLTTG